ncbi:MAG: hypothetical protein DRO96_02470 [Candidatus Aenigmatarchaeota archaeon]|nr:MAG: hypothetical protein DRO96_02470 [Candidatus Aenigmarchaeota archaeon]
MARANENYLLEKKLYNIKSLYVSGLVEFLKVELSNPSIILFGSYAKGEDTERSDIDLYIETPSKKDITLEKFEKKLKRNIQIFRHKNLFEIKNKDLVNNIINGIVLNGFVEVFFWSKEKVSNNKKIFRPKPKHFEMFNPPARNCRA